MENTYKTFVLLAPSRKEPLVVFLKLLVILAIYSQPVRCVPIEEIQFKIPAFGRTSQIGYLYDARRDTFIGVSIFKSNLPSHLLTTTQTPRINTESQIFKKESDKFKLFGVDLDTAASIKTGIVQPEGAASVLTENWTGLEGVTGVYLQTFQTADETLSIFSDELKQYFNTDAELFVDATHVVTGVNLGGSIAATFTETRASNRTDVQSINTLKQGFSKLKRTSEVLTNEAASFKMELTSDVSLTNPLSTTLLEVREQINHVRDSIKVINSGLGVPLKFTLTPISILKKYLKVTSAKTTTAHKVDAAILRKYLNIISDITALKKDFSKFEQSSNCISKVTHKEIQNLYSNFSTAEEMFSLQFKETLLGVKSGALNNSALSENLKQYQRQHFSPKNVQTALTLRAQALQKVDFCSQLSKEYLDIAFFGSAPNLISKIYQNHHKPTYVLFTKSEFKENDRVSYEDNLNIFLNLLYKPSNALFIVDCDFSYAQCELINGTVIKQIRQGKYTFNDVRLEIKITKMENKTKIVNCNKEFKESGVTGALCVSTVERKSAKLKSQTFKTNHNNPKGDRLRKVVGGTAAASNEFPFQVLFFKNSTGVHCGGSILDENFVLTAAHCLDDYKEEYKSWTIVAGEHNRDNDESTEQRRKIRDVHIHENYIPIAEVNDIAIVKLDRPLNLSSPAVQPILLPDADYEATGEAVVTGWGKVSYGGIGNPLILQKATVPIVDREVCVEAYEENQVFVSVKMLCAGDVVIGGVDACQGDSGGPLSVRLSNGSSMLIGVVSGGSGCGRTYYPGIYMQVSKYVDWISDTLNNFDNCTLREVCQHGGTCVDEITSFSCICPNGFAGKFCEYANICRYHGTCTPPNEAGNCHRCQDGFFKDPEDNMRCIDENLNASLVIASATDIRMISMDKEQTTKIIRNGDDVGSIDYNFQTNTIFWSSDLDKKIYTAQIGAETEKTSIFHDRSYSIVALAVDWIHQHLYWADWGRKQVCVSNFNGTMKKVLFKDILLTSIAVNPLNGWMYWSLRKEHNIETAGLDGSLRQVMLSTNLEHVKGIFVDFVDSRLFWSQGTDPGSIFSCNFDGSDRKLIFRPNPPQFASSSFWKLATFDKYIYFIEWNSKTIYSVNKCNNGEELNLIHKYNANLYDLKILEGTIQPKGESLCSKRKGHCSHFCFPVPSPGSGSVSTTKCGCPDGLSLSADQKNCI